MCKIYSQLILLKCSLNSNFINQFTKYLLIGSQKKRRMFCHVDVKISSKRYMSQIALLVH